MVQLHPQQPPQTSLPTMYDLPSEDPEEPGLPDEFHDLQPALLTATYQSPRHPRPNCFIGTDLNIYYDSDNTRWYKKPDWFLVLGVPRSRNYDEMRLSYVIWQERVNPFLVVELLSPGTEDEDLGRTQREPDSPPTKWQVYQDILQVPYYVIYDRYENQFRGFHWQSGSYQALDLREGKLWFPELELGLGVWWGVYDGIEGLWLRFYEGAGNWIPTPSEQVERERQEKEVAQERAEQERQRAEQERQRAEQERQRAEQERQRAEQERQRAEQEHRKNQELLARLQELGIDPNLLS